MMREETWLTCSFAATIAYGLLAIACLLIAGVALHSRVAICAALLAAASAYLCQLLATTRFSKFALALQLVSIWSFIGGMWAVIGA